ncbi:motility protein A [Thiomicrorhabdus immobilis]|uniref:Motility protein A n=1 Tax=Thiomicrorhabdus immobilis TaxID=2791037 RepID=A0ABN6CUG8_9GAMM|nr:MotA/TolQ/ExbB proton channel family protein [Thiomicrorhabdus immobilis]BCN92635.1 motility protein A [Thiomicrorhabdus immobilis]
MSKFATLLGILIGSIILVLSMIDYQQGQFIYAFLNWQGLALVLGGTFAAILINYPLSQVACVFKGFAKVLTSEPAGYKDIIEEMVRLSHISKQKGLLGVENEIDSIEDRYLKFALTEMLVYQNSDTLRQSLENRLFNIRLRHLSCQEVFGNMASYAPAFGMMGTVMGLIIMMTTQVTDTGSPYGGANGQDMLGGLLSGMGLALVTTFYGVLFSNLVFLPIAGKLKVLTDAEVLRNEMIIQGVIALKKSDATLLVKEQLLAYVNEKTKQKLESLR